ncbi:MAG: hypothetical protein V1749_07210 [Candidatus Desantisbacteria bacterium]
MALTAEDLTKLNTAITDPTNGVLAKINELAAAPSSERSKKIVPLIGAMISLIITAVKAVMD